MKFHYQCIDCHSEYEPASDLYLCPACRVSNTTELPPRGVLQTIYDYDYIRKKTDFNGLKKDSWLPLLPIESMSVWPNLRIGNTPLYSYERMGDKKLGHRLLIKDESQNPSFSLKDRASALVSAYARENDIKTIVTASTGNAGSALACICACQGQRAVVLVPAKTPIAKLTQIRMYGGEVIRIDGSYDEAYEHSLWLSREHGWYNRNTGYNPFTIEGKKTVSFELFDQLKGEPPDLVFIPSGDGVILSGVYRGFEDLIRLRLTDKMPLMVAVQSSGSENLHRNLYREKFQIIKSNTVADSISVDVPRNFFMSKNFLKKYNGITMSLADEKILEASIKLSRHTGLFAEPAAAAGFAAYIEMDAMGKIPAGSSAVVISTGCGLKDISTIQAYLS